MKATTACSFDGPLPSLRATSARSGRVAPREDYRRCVTPSRAAERVLYPMPSASQFKHFQRYSPPNPRMETVPPQSGHRFRRRDARTRSRISTTVRFSFITPPAVNRPCIGFLVRGVSRSARLARHWSSQIAVPAISLPTHSDRSDFECNTRASTFARRLLTVRPDARTRPRTGFHLS